MAASSKYIQLSSSVLMEYQYADQSDLGSHQRTTSNTPFFKMHNEYNDSDYIFNNDNSEPITGNVRDRSAVLIDQTTSKYAYLNIDGISIYNDIDDKLTSSNNLDINPDTVDLVVYDKVILHFVQGFNFEQKEGLMLEISALSNQDKKIILSNFTYLEEDNFALLNSSPFLFNGKQYTSYVEFEIPSLYNLISDYNREYLTQNESDILAYTISPSGYKLNNPLNLKFGFIDNVETVNGNIFLTSYYREDIKLSIRDQFADVTASIEESENGDFYELSPKSNGLNIENFINNLNNEGGDYIILHDIVVYEQLSNGFRKTADLQIAQVDEFQDPIYYRPIIQNSNNAVSYKIDYVARLYNRLDNTQIWKAASITNMDVKKYGRSLAKLQIGKNPVIANVYNELVQKNLSVNADLSEDSAIVQQSGYTKYVTSFIETSNVHLSSDIVYQKMIDGEAVYVSKENASSNDVEIFGQGQLDLDIFHSDTYYKFIIYADDRLGQKTPMDLNGIGELKIQFWDNDNLLFEIPELSDSKANRSKGEAIFKLPASKSKELANKKDQPLYIVSKPEGEKSNETVLYKSIFTGPGAEQTNKKLSKYVKDLKTDVNKLTSQLNEAEQVIEDKRVTEKELKSYITKIQKTVDNYKKQLDSLKNNPILVNENIQTKDISRPELPENALNSTDDYVSIKDSANEAKSLLKEIKKSRGVSNTTAKQQTKARRPESQTQKEKQLSKNKQNTKKGSNKFKTVTPQNNSQKTQQKNSPRNQQRNK